MPQRRRQSPTAFTLRMREGSRRGAGTGHRDSGEELVFTLDHRNVETLMTLTASLCCGAQLKGRYIILLTRGKLEATPTLDPPTAPSARSDTACTPMEASCAAVTYAEQLVRRGHGLPLWHPEPQPEPFGETDIGDVGFVSEGRFIRLFNALHTADHPINASRVPLGFVPLQPNERLLRNDLRAVDPRPICTTSTTWKQITVEADASM